MTKKERDELPVDPKTGLKYFVVMGQTRYLCPAVWESGAPCERDHYDANWILDHANEPHNATGTRKAVTVRNQRVSSLVDERGKQIVYDEPATGMENVRFKK